MYEVREKLFGKGWPLKADQEREARLHFQFKKLDFLVSGNNVLLDTCAITNIDRKENFLIPDFVKTKLRIKKYLVYLDTERSLLLKRNLCDKERDKKTFWEILKTMDTHWQDPKTFKSKDVKLLVYKNNTEQDLEKTKKKLYKLVKV